MNEAARPEPLPALPRALLTDAAALLAVEHLVVFGGAALDLLAAPSPHVKDLDVALPLEGPRIPSVLIRLRSRTGPPLAPLRPYFINRDQPVLMVEHAWKGYRLDVNFVDQVHRIPQFDIESVQWRYPECDYVDLYGAFDALAAGEIQPVWGLDQNNPILLLNRVLRLAAKYGLRLAGHHVHQATIDGLNERTRRWEALDDFHGRQAKEAHYRTIASVARRASDPPAYLGDVAASRAVETTVPELQRLLDRGPQAWTALARVPRTEDFWPTVVSLLPESPGRSLTERLPRRTRTPDRLDVSPLAPTVGIVIPAHDEAEYIEATLRSLTAQEGIDDTRSVEIVVVENASSDQTAAVVSAYAASSGTPIVLVQQQEASMVTSRARGFANLLARAAPPRHLVSADADTLFPRSWLRSVLWCLEAGADVVSGAGYMTPDLWARCPRLVERYMADIGTIFFDPVTIERLGVSGESFLFTEEVFRDFGRPVSDAGFAMTSECYQQVGGFRRYRYADGKEMAAVGWPFLMRADALQARVEYMSEPFWHTSPRRLLQEPAAVFTTTAYRGVIAAFRSEEDDEYRVLDGLAPDLDLRPLQEYCLKYYILQRCVSRPVLLRQNERYFGSHLDKVEKRIRAWRDASPSRDPGSIFVFLDELSQRLAEPLLDQVLSLRLRA